MNESSPAPLRPAPPKSASAPQSSAMRFTRRQWLGLAGGGVATAAVLVAASRHGRADRESKIDLMMYASSACQCCHLWVAHLEEHGFRVQTRFVTDVGVTKTEFGVPQALWSCHTAKVDGYLVEGHVPAGILKRLLAERPEARGLAAPGMPGGSPGMESAPKEPFDVIAFAADGSTRVYARV